MGKKAQFRATMMNYLCIYCEQNDRRKKNKQTENVQSRSSAF